MPDLNKTEAIEKKTFEFSKYTLPLFKLNDRDIPYVTGSGILILRNGKKYIWTAAHVLDKNPRSERDTLNEIWCFSGGELKQVQSDDLRRGQAPVVPEDKIDVASILLDEEFAAKIDQGEFYEIGSPIKPLENDNYYLAAMGFPSSKNKLNWEKKGFKKNTHAYFGELKSIKELDNPLFDPASHTAIKFDMESCYSNGQFRQKAVNPHGISGGPIWLVHEKGRDVTLNFSPILVGVATEYSIKKKYLVGTSINVLLQNTD